MSLNISTAANSVIAEHQAFIAKAKAAFAAAGDAERIGYINLRQFGTQYTAAPASTVRTWFTVWESARITDALRAVADRHQDKNVIAAARRLIRQRRLWWLHAIDARLSGWNPQRLLNLYETEALVVALRIARATAVSVERQLADDFDVNGESDEFDEDFDSADRDADHDNNA